MSSHKNKSIREKLEKKYGKGCMFKNAHIAERIEAMGGIKTYKQYIAEHRYKLKKIIQLENTMTLHHLKHRSEGGATSENNGAITSALAQGYIHSLEREHEEIINNMLREYKINFTMINGEEHGSATFDLSQDYIELPLDIVTPEKRPKEKFNRAKEKREFQKIIEEEWER